MILIYLLLLSTPPLFFHFVFLTNNESQLYIPKFAYRCGGTLVFTDDAIIIVAVLFFYRNISFGNGGEFLAKQNNDVYCFKIVRAVEYLSLCVSHFCCVRYQR